jgi:hypothetical protein
MNDNIETQAESARQVIEDGAADALKKSNPKLFDLIDTAIRRDKLTPKKIDKYIYYRFGLKKGNVIRDMCYLAALSIERRAKAAT